MNIQPTLFKDFYKSGHGPQYPQGVNHVYSNLTPRASRIPGIDGVVVFAIQSFIKRFLIEEFNNEFFNQPKDEVVEKYQRRMNNALGLGVVNTDHIAALHDLQYLPIKIKALPEGTICPLRVPLLTIINTRPAFFWLTNFLETLISCELWHPITTATIAHSYRQVLDKFAAETSDMPEFVDWQGHDFSMRGSVCVEAAMKSGAAHLLSFTGTDTIPAIDYLEEYYNADSYKELVGGSVPATEHAVMCLGGKETEIETFRRLITKTYPKGIISIVSDTWDFWKVMTETLPRLKDEILARDGKVVIRPDSGDPATILCGDPYAPVDSPAWKGAVTLLWDLFGGETNSKGYKQLDSHIGLIYGDSITHERCVDICSRLKCENFASTNIVFGIGSYTYQYVTRDTFGFAIKATHGVINYKPIELYKAPATDDGTKNSAKGLLRVNADMTLSECVTPEEEREGMLRTVFEDGQLLVDDSLATIRARLKEHSK